MAVRDPLEPPADARALSEVPVTATPLIDAGERILGHRFARPDLLIEAMTHRSAARRAPGTSRSLGSNERLEFIGDRVLGLVIAEWLIERFAHEQEGELGRRLAQLVAQPALAAIAEAIGMAEMLAVSPGEARAGVKTRATVTADALEAAIGAIYLDGGLDAARGFIRRAWEPVLTAQHVPPKDAKSALQEWTLGRGLGLPRYSVVSRSGPPHQPIFAVMVRIDGPNGTLGEACAEAGSKRVAEHAAAARLLAQVIGP